MSLSPEKVSARHAGDDISQAHWLDPQSPAFDAQLLELSKEFAATAAQLDAETKFPKRNFERLHQLGLLQLTIPTADGGRGESLATALKVIGHVARGEPSTALILAIQFIEHALDINGKFPWPEHLRQKITRDAVENGALHNVLSVEPELGTPSRGGLPATVARRDGDGWRLSGRKIFSTGSTGLSWFSVIARTAGDAPQIGQWLIKSDTPGIEIIETWDHLGMRATCSHDVVLTDVFVPLDQVLHLTEAGVPPKLDPDFMLWNAVLLPALYNGVAHSARDWLAQWLHSRKPANLGASLATLPRMQEALGEIDALLLANRLILDAAVNARVASGEVGQVKFLVTSNAIAAVEKAIALSGNPGLSRNNALERHYRNVLCSRIHSPQNDMILTRAGKTALDATPPTTTV